MARLWECAQPSLEAMAARYRGAHDSLVASEAYNSALQSAQGVLDSMQGSPLFRRLYPLLSPVAESTLDCIAQSPYYEVRFTPSHYLSTSVKAAFVVALATPQHVSPSAQPGQLTAPVCLPTCATLLRMTNGLWATFACRLCWST